MPLNKKTAKSLAIAYSAWCTAAQESDSTGIIAWGPRLIDLQASTGVILVDVNITERLVNAHRPRFREAI